MTPVARRRERGAISIVMGVAVFVLLSIVGLLVDLGHVYVVKTELQNAADACALSAARELNDKSAGATKRARGAGISVASLNSMDVQSRGVEISEADIMFSAQLDAGWQNDIDANTVYARCSLYREPYSVVQWVAHVGERQPMRVSAAAIARPVGGKTYCAVPIAMCSTSGDGSDFQKGAWYSGRMATGTATTGNYDWVRLQGQGASDLGDVVAGPGVCNIQAPTTVDAQGGVAQGVAQAWNTRFGLYGGSYKDSAAYPPDVVGYAFTKDRLNDKGQVIPGSWPSLITSPAPPLPAGTPTRLPAHDAYDGKAAGWDESYTTRLGGGEPNKFKLPYDPRALLDDNGKPMVLPGNPAPLSPDLHLAGQDRRMVFMPIIRCGTWEPNKKNIVVNDWACAFMLHPINDPNKDVELEFRGLWSAGECATTGVPGAFGPPVPALVR